MYLPVLMHPFYYLEVVFLRDMNSNSLLQLQQFCNEARLTEAVFDRSSAAYMARLLIEQLEETDHLPAHTIVVHFICEENRKGSAFFGNRIMVRRITAICTVDAVPDDGAIDTIDSNRFKLLVDKLAKIIGKFKG